jgi:lipid-binding SYLF domain-containing protein
MLFSWQNSSTFQRYYRYVWALYLSIETYSDDGHPKGMAPMQWIHVKAICIVLVFTCAFSSCPVMAGHIQEETIRAATIVLNDTMAMPLNRIPQAMLANAHGVAIIPNVIKGGFIVGARHGRGVLFTRDAGGSWHAPVFVSLTGGNIGWQVGVQSSDIILVFRTERSVQGVLNGKLTLGADAAAAAGPIGRQGAIATDGQLQAEIFSYSRSRGLFAGVSIDGSVLSIDQAATNAFYQPSVPGAPASVPQSAQVLTSLIAAHADGALVSQGDASVLLPSQVTANQPDVLRGQLQQAASNLFGVLDEQWRDFLRLPPEVFSGGTHPALPSVNTSLGNYELVATNAQWQALSQRDEFQMTYRLLKEYHQSLAMASGVMQLPPPPGAAQSFLPR